ncbi:uncharacterized protein J3R85_007084 [Psidium guajava]|nr:uncharacterized protein J3R85_007084 [Psidium guajava]
MGSENIPPVKQTSTAFLCDAVTTDHVTNDTLGVNEQSLI